MKHIETLDLQGKSRGNEALGRIQLEIQWIWSEAEYCETLVQEYDKEILRGKQELQALQDYLQKLLQPFGLDSVGSAKRDIKSKESVPQEAK